MSSQWFSKVLDETSVFRKVHPIVSRGEEPHLEINVDLYGRWH